MKRSHTSFCHHKFSFFGFPYIDRNSVPAGISVVANKHKHGSPSTMIFLIVQFSFAESLTYFAKHSILVASTLTNKNEENINSLTDRKTENVNGDTTNLIKVKKLNILLRHSI